MSEQVKTVVDWIRKGGTFKATNSKEYNAGVREMVWKYDQPTKVHGLMLERQKVGNCGYNNVREAMGLLTYLISRNEVAIDPNATRYTEV